MKKIFYFASLAALPFLWAGCSDDDNDNPGKAYLPAKLEIRMTDAPAAYDEVNIEVLSVSVHAENPKNTGWLDYNLRHPGVYNLLDYQNGVDTLLITEEIAAGKLKEIRLILGENNTVVIGGESYKLTTPSAQQSGLKFKFPSDVVLEPGKTYRIWIDFDANRSIHETGSGKYMLKPVIRAFAEAYGGALSGIITPPDATEVVQAILGADTLVTYPNDNGEFLFIGLEPAPDWKLRYFLTNPELFTEGTFPSEKMNIVVKDGEVIVHPITVTEGAETSLTIPMPLKK